MSDLPIDWESGAAARHTDIGISLDKLFAARDLVRGAMGTAWWEQQERKDSRDVTQKHPLFRQLTAPNDLALVEVAELAHYLTAFRGDAALSSVISDLRGPKFWAAFYELAMAHRWADAGAAVVLAPATAKGAADFRATIDDTNFVVEVSAFEDDFVGSFRTGVPLRIVEAVEKALQNAPPFVCKIIVHEEFTPASETPLRAVVKQACYAFGQRLRDGGDMVTIETPACTVTLERLSDASETNPFRIDEFGQQVSVRPHSWNAYIAGSDARFFFQFKPEERSFRDELLKKVTKEMKQLSRTNAATVVMIDVSTFGDFFSLPFPALENDLLNLLRQHQRVASLWFFSRQWTTAFRYKYWWTHLENPYASVLVPEPFLDRLIDREWRWDFLGGREYVSTTPENDARSYAARMAIRR